KEGGKSSSIEVFLIGEIISNDVEAAIKEKLAKYSLAGVDLHIIQSKDNSTELADKLGKEVKSGIIEELYKRNEELIKNKEEKIKLLENQLQDYNPINIPFNSISK